MKNPVFNPLSFLVSLGAGGISVMPFAFFQYTYYSGSGLISASRILWGRLSPAQSLFFIILEAVMIIFGLIHVLVSFNLFNKLRQWIGSDDYRSYLNDPLRNAGLLAPFISIGMTFNVVIGSLRFFVPVISDNLQSFMLFALIMWGVLWGALLRTEIRLLKISFERSYDINKISFGWLLHPFALGMVTVAGTGIAAIAQSPSIAAAAAFMSFVSGSMGFFLLAVKLAAVFKSHFAAPGLPDRQFLPSFLIVIPVVTLFAVSGFRLVHYFEKQLNYHIGWMGTLFILTGFAFQTWYFAFGLSMLKKYFSEHFFEREFYVTQWSFICPFVGYAVMGAFLYKVFIPNSLLYALIILTMIVAVGFYGLLSYRNLCCRKLINTHEKWSCDMG
jgi:hypothetical protein